ncbi:ferritin-like domain-containing protein [Streptomyces sp. H10-C2]|uniref:ferritin-like domain-containing protein n=1 Tax=unclassified Streptomyces TaxID=2593676 RepID=UPI0024BB779A|nr:MULTISPECIES: ferritin-like domain-containing protein [unclassified Streptomyces]MDJ0346766.1 ferritin-like domain-containing protein [Streptomyces sp. PH10-H1]MDJ0374076.1 ferritin-like domain-containing protein [Streptomyces sp. H10-C2]
MCPARSRGGRSCAFAWPARPIRSDTATGLYSEPVAAEFLEHAQEEQIHADKLAQRIAQLGGEPDFDPETLSGRSHTPYDASLDLIETSRRTW